MPGSSPGLPSASPIPEDINILFLRKKESEKRFVLESARLHDPSKRKSSLAPLTKNEPEIFLWIAKSPQGARSPVLLFQGRRPRLGIGKGTRGIEETAFGKRPSKNNFVIYGPRGLMV